MTLMAKNKKKKEKITYIDDGRTVADMSGVSGGRKKRSAAPRASAREQFRTYLAAVKMMLVPMFVTIGIICVAFLVMWLLLR